MVDSMWESAHVGTPCENLPALDNLWKSAMVDSMWESAHVGTPLCSSLQFSMSKSDEIIALCTLKIACTAEIIHISVFCATIFSEYGLAAG
jgi:hypothetical protein